MTVEMTSQEAPGETCETIAEDSRVRQALIGALRRFNRPALAQVSVTVHEGMIILEGRTTYYERSLAENLVRQMGFELVSNLTPEYKSAGA